MPGRHHQTGGHRSRGRAPRWPVRAVRWLSQPGSGEALVSWGIVCLTVGALVTVFTLWGTLLIIVGLIVGAFGLDLAA